MGRKVERLPECVSVRFQIKRALHPRLIEELTDLPPKARRERVLALLYQGLRCERGERPTRVEVAKEPEPDATVITSLPPGQLSQLFGIL